MTTPDPRNIVRHQLVMAKQAIDGAKRDKEPHSVTIALTSLHTAVAALASIVIGEDGPDDEQPGPDGPSPDGVRPRSVPRDPNEPNIGTMKF